MGIETGIRLLKRRRTKIVATLGPASREPAMIEKLIRAGVNVFRLNMSHGTHADHRAAYDRVRAAAASLNEPVAALADLCGPKIRAGKFRDGRIELADGATVTVTVRDVAGEPGLIPSQYRALAGDVKPGDRILLDDGKLELRVVSAQGTEIACTVVYGGTLKDHKGINLPGVNVSAPSLTEKDLEDARFALDLGVDYIALSFVRRAADLHALRALMTGGRAAAIVAKIEKPEALEDIDAILEACDAIMVARGDLGVELPPQTVPVTQDQLVERARACGRPVIVATQMLESMIENSRPTRAEVSDISHAVRSGADAVMLSAESAAGRFPAESVAMMDAVARHTESHLWGHGAFGSITEKDVDSEISIEEAVARATAQISRDLLVRAIVAISMSGRTATVVSAARPAAPVLAITTDAAVCRRMNLLWGVVPVLAAGRDLDDAPALAQRLAREHGLAESGNRILLVRGFSHSPERNQPNVTVVSV